MTSERSPPHRSPRAEGEPCDDGGDDDRDEAVGEQLPEQARPGRWFGGTEDQNGELDFGVITMPHNPAVAGLTRIPLVSMPVGVQMRTDHSLAGRDHLYWHDLETWPIVTMRAGTVMWEMLHRHVTAPDIAVQAMSARGAMVMVGRGSGLGVLARFETSADIPDLICLPLRDARPVHLCLTQRRDGQPSRSALVVRQLVRAKADELAAPRSP